MSQPPVIARRSGIWARAPDILLLQLFEHGVRAALHDDGLPFALRVSHVCRYWRAVAAASPSVWTAVPVHPPRAGLAELFFARAGGHLPLDVCLHLRSERKADAALAFVLAQNERIRAVCLHAQGNPAVFLFISRLRRMTLPRLAHFEIYLHLNPKGGPLGHLPPILDPEPPPTLTSVALRGVCFELHSAMLKGLTSLTLADLPRRMAAPSYTTFRDLLTASPNLSHLRLAGVFPVLAHEIDYGEIVLARLQTLELAMERDASYVCDFFLVLCAPDIHTLAFESPWAATWQGFEDALPILDASFALVRTLRLRATGDVAASGAGARPELFRCFPRLAYLTLTAARDALVLHYLRPWLAVMQGQCGGEFADGDAPCAVPVWPHLELLTVRAPFDSGDADEDDDEEGIDDALEFLGSLRLSMDLPFEVWQECVSSA